MDPRSWLDRLVGLCLTLLVAAIALHIAVRLVEAIWLPLAVFVSFAVVIMAGIGWWRYRSGGW